ncbi:hypothetical protein KM043_003109 [Ampulex compressa]|nr:hypothetical protein KM043_003109 [Ampulex compressa]
MPVVSEPGADSRSFQHRRPPPGVYAYGPLLVPQSRELAESAPILAPAEGFSPSQQRPARGATVSEEATISRLGAPSGGVAPGKRLISDTFARGREAAARERRGARRSRRRVGASTLAGGGPISSRASRAFDFGARSNPSSAEGGHLLAPLLPALGLDPRYSRRVGRAGGLEEDDG